MDTSIKLQNLSTGYDGVVITNGINAELRSGELTCLLGPNGAGKSTLLRTLCGFAKPICGEIFVNGQNISGISPRRLAQTIGVVLTERPSAMNMTVEELVAIGRSPYTSFFGGLRAEDKEIVDRAIALVNIEDLRQRNINTLSDGERQKCMIAKALAQQTQIIFLDEPTAFLDYPSKVEIMKLLFKLARVENKTVFMSTHDLELALQIADKIWLLDKRLGLNIGVPEDLAWKGLLAEYFQRPGLSFDPSTCSFAINHEKAGIVRYAGEGPLASVVARALARVGIEIDRDAANEVEVRGTQIRFNGEPVPDIQSLLDAVSSSAQ